MASLYDPAAVGQTYEAVGPHRMTQVNPLVVQVEISVPDTNRESNMQV